MGALYKIAVMGGRDTIMGFSALGLEICPVESAEQARGKFLELARSDEYAVIYLEENLAAELKNEIAAYKESIIPAVILIPGRDGSLGLGQTALREAVERAVGSNIL